MGVARRKFQKKLSIAVIIVMIIQFFSGCMEQTPATAHITGCVTAEDGSCIPGVKVTFLLKETFTDAKGSFSLEVSPGTGKLSLSKEGCLEVAIVVKAVAKESIDTEPIVLPKKSGVIIKIEELTEEEYVPGPDADNFIQYYTDMGFDEIGAVQMECTAGTMNVFSLVTSTESAFVLEGSGTAGIVFDFSEEVKEIHTGDMVLSTAFDSDEWHTDIPSLHDVEWGSEEDEKTFQKIFAEKMKEKSEVLEFIKIVMEIKDLAHHNLFCKVRRSYDAHTILSISLSVREHGFVPLQQKVLQGSEKREYGVEISLLDGFNLDAIINGFWDAMIEAMKEMKKDLEEEEKNFEDLKKEFEDEIKKIKDGIKNLEDEIKKIEDLKKELEDEKEELEDKKKKAECTEEGKIEEDIKKIEEKIKKIEEEIKEAEDLVLAAEEGIKIGEESITEIEKRLKEIEQSKMFLDNLIKKLTKIDIAQKLRENAHLLLDQAMEQDLDFSEIEDAIKKAEELLEKASEIMESDPSSARSMAEEAAEIYERAISDLEALLG
jgi:hypothetical protein